MKEPDLKALADVMAERIKTGINDGSLLTVAGVKLHMDKLIEEAGLGNTGIAGLADAIKAMVDQRIPASSVFNGNRAKALDARGTELGMTELRALEVKTELVLAINPNMGLERVATMLGVSRDFVNAAQLRVVENTKKTLSAQSGAAGGFGVPTEFVAEVQRKLYYSSPLRSNLRVWSGVGLKGTMERETGTVTVTYPGELVAPSVTDPTFGALNWGLNKRMSLMRLSNDLIRFSPINYIELLSTMFAEANRVKDDFVFFSGTGSNQPMGFHNNTTGMNTTAQAGASLAYDDLVALKHLLPVQYRLDGSFLAMNNAALQIVAKLKDDQNRPLFLDKGNGQGGIGGPGIPAQTIGFVLGLPVIELNSILSTYGSGDKTELWHLNKRAYSIFEGPTLEFETSNQASDAFTTDSTYARGISYDDGNVNIAEAAAYLSAVK